MNPKIASIILGIVLLSSVASFSPTPASGTHENNYVHDDEWDKQFSGSMNQEEAKCYTCGDDEVNETDDTDNDIVDSQMPTFVCKWNQSFVTLNSDWDNTGSPDEFLKKVSDYTHVLPGVTAYGGSFGMPVLTGTVNFAYQYEGGSLTQMTSRAVDPEYGSGQPLPFNYGVKVIRPDEREYIPLTIFCENNGRTESNTQLISVKGLLTGSDGETTSKDILTKDTDNDGVLDVDDVCKNTFGTANNLEAPGCPEGDSLLDICMEFLSEGHLELSLDCIDMLTDLSSAQKSAFRQLAYGDIVLTKDRTMSVKLKNVQINAGANSEFKITFNEDESDVIELLNGMYNFLFSDKITSGNPFYVKSPFVTIEHQGTEFIVNVDSTTNTTTVILLEGTIDATTDGETRTFSGENKFTVDSSGIIVDKVFSIYEWNALSDEIKPDSNSLTETEPNKIVSGDYLENIKIVSDNEEYFITANIGQKSPNTSSVRITIENECPFKKEILVKDFQYRLGAEVSYSFEQLSASKPSECALHFTLSTFEGKELETIVANYYLTIPDTESDYIVCPDVWIPVCGIDDKTYSNDCQAYTSGVEISSLGECTVGNSNGCPENYPYIWSNGQCYSQPDSNLLSNDCPEDYPYEHSNGDCHGYQESGSGPSFYANGCPEDYPFMKLRNGECNTTPDPDVNIIPYFDSDGDGVPDIEDACPELYGLMFPIGCPDVPLPLSDPTPLTAKSSENETSSDGGGCLIATATFGSELAPQVQLLRELRDNSLLNTESGTAFMGMFNDVYYSFSPYIADYERDNPLFKEMVKIAITPMISSLSILNYVEMDSEESVLGYGISLIILNGMMYVGIPIVALVGIRKKF